MDKAIPQRDIRRRRLRRYAWAAAILLGTVALLAYVRGRLNPTVKAGKFYTAVVELGEMDNTITATGTVVPGFEREINAPVSTEIKRVLKRNGEPVQAGDVILELDSEFTQLEYEKMTDELALRQNNLDKLRLQYDKDLRDLEYRDRIKAIEIAQLKNQVANQKRLRDIGGGTDEELAAAEMRLSVGELEKRILENELDYRRRVNHTEKASLELEYTIQRKGLQQFARKLGETSLKAPAPGVITWVVEDIGRRVSEGEPLAKIADLGRYDIEAHTADRNMPRLAVGQPVRIVANRETLSGTVSKVLPAVENNTVKFIVAINGGQTAALRPNMRAEVYLVTDTRAEVLKVRNGPAFKGGSRQEVYVVRDGRAQRTTIEKGMTNSDFIEILSGLQAGDEVIISDTKDFMHLPAFQINP